MSEYVVPWSGLGFVCPSELEAPLAEEADDPRRGCLLMPLRYVEKPRLRIFEVAVRCKQCVCMSLWSGESKTPGWCGGGDAISVAARLRIVVPFGSFVTLLR